MSAARTRPRGFTLMEIMIVVFIIALLSAAAIVSFSGERRDEELVKEAERIDALFDYVREQAELQTRDYGFRINRTTYSFVVFDGLANEWRPAAEDDALRARDIPEGIQPLVVVEGRHVRHSLNGDVGARYRQPTTDLVVLLRRLPDGSLFGAFSGRRAGRLVEGSFRSAP